MRLKIIRIGIILSFLFILSGLVYTQILRGQYYYHLSKNNRIRIVSSEGWRGRILDRNGTVLAGNRASYQIMIVPQEIQDIQELFRFLSKALGRDQKDLVALYQKRKTTPFSPVIIANDVNKKKIVFLEENKFLFPSLIVQENFNRVYPLTKNSAHVLGYVSHSNRLKKERLREYGYSPRSLVGYSGVEEFYDRYLKGGLGGSQIEVNNRGQQVRMLSYKEPVQGKDITLTIDAELQKIAMEVLYGHRGVVILMDTKTGDILALTSAPAYDPNVFSGGNGKKIAQVLAEPGSPLLNRAISGVVPPGSVFKIPVALCALDNKKINVHTTFTCPGYYELAGIRFNCAHTHGPQDFIESLAHSCNVYYYHLGLILGADAIGHYARLLGLGSLTGVDLPYERKGQVPSRRQRLLSGTKWYTGETLNFSIGQGETLVTPLQLARMMATVAEEGVEVTPHLIKEIEDEPAEKYEAKRRVKIDPTVFQTVKKGLRAAVANYSGTAHLVDVDGLYAAGKTGTAQSTRDRDHHAWFAGYVKGKGKSLSLCVFLEYGGSSQNACLLARQLLLKMKEKDKI